MCELWPGSLPEVQAELDERSLRLSKKLGQNFMIDGNIARQVAETTLKNHRGDSTPLVLEVGPGVGHLTRALLNAGAYVVAVELDKGFYNLLREKFAEEEKFELIHANALGSDDTPGMELSGAIATALEKLGVEHFYFASNLPYNIATTFLIALSSSTLPFAGGGVTMQLEAAERIVADAGSKIYGAASVLFRLAARAKIVRSLPRSIFWPRPNVTSALVEIEPLTAGAESLSPEFAKFIKHIFSQRRKKLRGTLAKHLGKSSEEIAEVLTDLKIEIDARAEVVAPNDLLKLFEAVDGLSE